MCHSTYSALSFAMGPITITARYGTLHPFTSSQHNLSKPILILFYYWWLCSKIISYLKVSQSKFHMFLLSPNLLQLSPYLSLIISRRVPSPTHHSVSVTTNILNTMFSKAFRMSVPYKLIRKFRLLHISISHWNGSNEIREKQHMWWFWEEMYGL